MRRVPLTVAWAVAFAAGCSQPAPQPDAQDVAQWLRSSLSFVRSERLGPPVASRISAYRPWRCTRGMRRMRPAGCDRWRAR